MMLIIALITAALVGLFFGYLAGYFHSDKCWASFHDSVVADLTESRGQAWRELNKYARGQYSFGATESSHVNE